MRHGHGTHDYNDERKYEGLWVNDKVGATAVLFLEQSQVESSGEQSQRAVLFLALLFAFRALPPWSMQ